MAYRKGISMCDGELNRFVQAYSKNKALKKLIFNKYDRNNLLIIVNDCGKIELSNFTANQRKQVQKLLDKYFKDWRNNGGDEILLSFKEVEE